MSGRNSEDDCQQVLRDLSRYLDGECAEDIDTVIRRHLDDCSPCLDRAGFERELRTIIAERCRDQAPAGLVERVLDSLRNP